MKTDLLSIDPLIVQQQYFCNTCLIACISVYKYIGGFCVKNGAKLLIAADCTAYVYANMHEDFMKGKVTMIGCPKLDSIDYSEKLTEIIRDNDIKSVTIVRMEVPCCGGLQRAAETALKNSGKFIPWQVVTISRDGEILD